MRVGIIGVGSMGQNHARVYADLAELVGVADIDRAAAKVTADRLGCRAFEDYRALLRSDVEAISIASPTAAHVELATAALDAGKHILVEKPVGGDPAACERLAELARAQGLTFAAGFIERHNPVVAFARQGLAEGRFGRLITLASRRVSAFPERVRDVGAILDLGIHDLDVMRYLVAQPPRSVYALGGSVAGEGHEDHVNILLDFEGGPTGFVEVNWLTPMKVRQLALTCTGNFVELHYSEQVAVISSSSFRAFEPGNLFEVPLELDVRRIALKKEEPLRRELQDFLDAIAARRPPLVTGEDAAQTLRVAQAAIVSLRRREKVAIAEA